MPNRTNKQKSKCIFARNFALLKESKTKSFVNAFELQLNKQKSQNESVS